MAYSYSIQYHKICRNCNSIIVYSKSDIIEEKTSLGYYDDIGIRVDKILICPNCKNRIIIESRNLPPENESTDNEIFTYDFHYCNYNEDECDYDRRNYEDNEYPDYYWDDIDD